MKAVRIHENGGLEVLKFEDAPEPEIQANEVLIEVKACSLNHLDLWMRAGVEGWKPDFPHILGSDVSGLVVKTGALARRVKVGDRVLVYPGISCGQCEYCFRGADSACRSYTVLGAKVDGGYAQYLKAIEANVFEIPQNLTFDEAAAVPLVFLTAWHMLVTRVALKPGEEVLIIGAGSGVGTAAIQVAKLVGARVIAVAGSDAKLEKARALGADEGINHRQQSIREEVRRITAKRGVDVVFDHVGEAVWEDCFNSLATLGRFVTCGVTSGHQVRLDLQSLFGRQRAVYGSFMGGKWELAEVLKHVASGRLKAVVDSVFPLEQAATAQSKMESRDFFGKILLRP
ncbi:MAG: zinc-binding dehydrogenase [Acidobacteriota bacterium]|nr:zinc-binding dehydrogenase [Acidobacteriota bacterium]